MDAYKPENLSTDLDNLSQEIFDMSSAVLSEEGDLSLDMLVEQEERQQPQTLEAEFADFTQPSTGSDWGDLSELDASIQPVTDSDVDIDLEFADFQAAQLLEKTDTDEAIADGDVNNDLGELNDLQWDQVLAVEPSQALEETVETELAAGLNDAPEVAMKLEIEAKPELDTGAESEPELELAPELAMGSEEDIEGESEASLGSGSDVAEAIEESVSSALEMTAELEEPSEPDAAPELPLQSALDADQQPASFSDLEILQDVNDTIDPVEFEALQNQSAHQGALIARLEAEIETLKANYEQSQLLVEQRIEPELYQSIQAEVQQLTVQVQDWEQRYDALSQKLDQQTQLANDRIDPEIHASLNQTVQEYSEQVQTLQSEKAALEATVQALHSQADAKIDRVEYDAVLEQLQRLKEKNARSLWTRIMDWIKGN